MNTEKRKILILGGGRGQVDLIKTAKRMGYYTIVASYKEGYPGLAIADEVLIADISDPEEMYRAAQKVRPDGVATACLDTGIRSLGFLCDRLGLPGLSFGAADLCNNKYGMKEALEKGGVRTANFRRVYSADDLKTAAGQLHMPLIIKAVDLQGSRGICIVKDEKDLVPSYEAVMSQTKQPFCIVEEYIEGTEFGAQAFVYHGEIQFVLPHGDLTYMSKTAIPVGHYAPYEGSPDLIAQAEEIVTKAIAALGIDNCAVNVDLIEKDGAVYIIELTGRVGANCLPELVSLYYGFDYYEPIVAMAMGEDPRPYLDLSREKTANLSNMLFSERAGTLAAIRDTNDRSDERIVNITFFKEPGETVNKFTNSTDCVGQVIVKAPTLAECRERMEEVKKNIVFEWAD